MDGRSSGVATQRVNRVVRRPVRYSNEEMTVEDSTGLESMIVRDLDIDDSAGSSSEVENAQGITATVAVDGESIS